MGLRKLTRRPGACQRPIGSSEAPGSQGRHVVILVNVWLLVTPIRLGSRGGPVVAAAVAPALTLPSVRGGGEIASELVVKSYYWALRKGLRIL